MTNLDPKRKQEIIEKIRACFARADVKRSGWEAEAETSMRMAKRLMADYNLSQAEVELGDMDKDNNAVSPDIVEEGGLDHYKNLENYEIMLTHVCEYLFNVKPIIKNGWNKHTGKTGRYLVFIGFATDVALAKEVYSILRADVNALHAALGVGCSAADKYQYRMGVATTLAHRAKEMAAGLSPEQEEKCRALVVVKDQQIDKWMQKEYPNLRSTRARTRYSDAYMQGRKDGQKVSMDFRNKLK